VNKKSENKPETKKLFGLWWNNASARQRRLSFILATHHFPSWSLCFWGATKQTLHDK
jgi:hypothetical protein